MQALVGLKLLKRIDEVNKIRILNAAQLSRCLNKNIDTLKDEPVTKPTYYFFVILTHNANSLSRKLLIKGIDTGKYIMRDCAMGCRNDGSYFSTQEAIRMSLQIPNYPQLGQEDVRYIAEVLGRKL
jgi:dTDP-4-amino-4,6-dideoxygalactose transaminase